MFADHPLLRRFENKLDMGEHRLEWTTHRYDFFCRPCDAEVGVIWCTRDWTGGVGRHLSPKLRCKLARMIQNRLLWRYWPLEGKRGIYFLSRYCIVDYGKCHEVRINLERRFQSSNHLLNSTQEMQTIVNSFGDKIDRVWSAIHQSEKDKAREKGWSNVQFSLGTREQLIKLVQAIGTLLRQPDDEFWWEYSIRPDFSEPIYLHPLKIPYSEPSLDEEDYQHFFSHLKTQFLIESNILPIFHRYGWEMENLWPRINMSSRMPTQHEKLEALLTWRDFLRDKIPASEIDALLRPFQ